MSTPLRRSARISSSTISTGDVPLSTPTQTTTNRYSLRQRTPRPAADGAATPSSSVPRKKRNHSAAISSCATEPRRRRSSRIKSNRLEEPSFELSTDEEREKEPPYDENINYQDDDNTSSTCLNQDVDAVMKIAHVTETLETIQESVEEQDDVDEERDSDPIEASQATDKDAEENTLIQRVSPLPVLANKENNISDVSDNDDGIPDSVSFSVAKDNALKQFRIEQGHAQRKESEMKLKRTLKHEMFRLQKEEKYKRNMEERFPQDKLQSIKLALAKQQEEKSSEQSSKLKKRKEILKKASIKKPKTLKSVIKKGQKIKVHIQDDDHPVPAGIESARQFLNKSLYSSNKYKRSSGLYMAVRRLKKH